MLSIEVGDLTSAFYMTIKYWGIIGKIIIYHVDLISYNILIHMGLINEISALKTKE